MKGDEEGRLYRPPVAAMDKHYLYKLGSAAKAWRNKAGYTQKEIALDLGFGNSYISLFESGLADSAVILAWYCERGFDPAVARMGKNDSDRGS